MLLSRSRSLLLSGLFACTCGAAAVAAQQDDPKVAVNGGPTVITASMAAQPSRGPRTSAAGADAATSVNRVGVQNAQTIPLSLNDAIRRLLENNNDLEVSRGDVQFQETQVRSLLGIYDPVFGINPTYSRSSTTGSAATHDFRLNSNFSQFISRGGGNYQVFFNNTRSENAFTQAQVSSGSVLAVGNTAIYSSSFGINYTQPLARNRSFDNTRRQILIARKRLEQTDSDFRLDTTVAITAVQQGYWDLVFAMRNQQNQVANVNLAKENLRQIEVKIEAGASAPLERAEVATELANREGDLLVATQQVSIAENNLKRLLLRDPLAPEWAQTIVPTDNPSVAPDAVSLDAAMKDAMDNRFELKRLKIQREINEADIRFFKNQTKPQIDLNTTFSLDGLARGGTNTAFDTKLLLSTTDIFLFNALNTTRAKLGLPPIINPTVSIPAAPSFLFGGFNQSLGNMFRSDSPNFLIGATISFPFRNRTARADLEGARIQEAQTDAQIRSQEQLVVTDVRNAVQAVETTRQRVLTARRARENAEVQLEGERKLYEAGKSTTFILFQRENALTNARNAEIRAETDHNKAIADLQRATSTAFRANNIEIVSPIPEPR